MNTLETSSNVIKAHDIRPFRFRDTPFVNLMNKRIYNVLLIASRYDMFMLEDDGRVDEQIFNEYTSLSLRYPPRFTQVNTKEEASEQLDSNRYDLVIFMPNMDSRDTFSFAQEIRSKHVIPIVLLTPFSKEVTKTLAKEDLSGFDYVFSWLGNSDLLLAIIKLIEDRMNVEHDVRTVGVQTILVVEDSIRFYSSELPLLFKYVLTESKEFSKEALNDHLQTLRMRGRPKILLARTFEEAQAYYAEYGNNMLGIVSDISFAHNGIKDKQAGFRFGDWVRNQDKYIPIIYMSSEIENRQKAEIRHAVFIDKNSKIFPLDFRRAIKDEFGFGDFVIYSPSKDTELFRIRSLKELQDTIHQIPDDSLRYHFSRNHFSRFFYSRAMFPVAEMLKTIDVSDYANMNDARELIYATILEYRRMKNTGVVAVFDKERYDKYSNFARIGEGSMGGKGRGLAFVGQIVKMNPELNLQENLPVRTPKTVVLCSDLFDEFMEENNLYPLALSDATDDEIFQAFQRALLPKRLVSDFFVFLDAIDSPIAVRSSSLLEDSQYQPFAGIYSTYMVPFCDKYDMLEHLGSAVKAVYASVFYADSKAYMTATQNLIDQEKMAIVVQELVGTQYGDYYYPAISGVARSINYYPIGNEQPEEGIVNLALGLGRYIVEGSRGLRFSPLHPHNILQLSTLETSLSDTQSYFYALDMSVGKKNINLDEGFNHAQLPVKDAEVNGPMKWICSTYDARDGIIRDGFHAQGRKIVSFAHILKYDTLPLASTLHKLLEIGEREMGRPVEIEFAVDLNDNRKGVFYVLQIRPIVDSKEVVTDDLSVIPKDELILFSNSALGNGVVEDIQDVVYIKSASFDAAHNPQRAIEIEQLNKQFIEQEREYILVGPGRWGSSDSWLGVPVKWPHISQARLIVECGLGNYRVDPSQGTHFFQNLTSFGVGYFTVNPYLEDGGYFDEEYLNTLPATYESEYVRHVRLPHSVTIKINGRKKMGVVLK